MRASASAARIRCADPRSSGDLRRIDARPAPGPIQAANLPLGPKPRQTRAVRIKVQICILIARAGDMTETDCRKQICFAQTRRVKFKSEIEPVERGERVAVWREPCYAFRAKSSTNLASAGLIIFSSSDAIRASTEE